MSDPFSGINRIGPAYPVRPVQPVNKDRKPGERKKKERDMPERDRHDDDENKPTIDEIV